MSVASQRAAIVALIQGVANIGLVHAEQPFARTEVAFRALYLWADGVGGHQVRGWYVRRVRTAERELSVGRVQNTHTWQIKGFMALADEASALVFEALVEALRKAWRLDPSLAGALAPGPMEPSGLQLTDNTPVILAGVLCHSATLAATTYEYLNAGE